MTGNSLSQTARIQKVGAPKAAKDAQFQQKTINIICESFSNGEDSKQIDKIITEQNVFWLIAIILWLFDSLLIHGRHPKGWSQSCALILTE